MRTEATISAYSPARAKYYYYVVLIMLRHYRIVYIYTILTRVIRVEKRLLFLFAY